MVYVLAMIAIKRTNKKRQTLYKMTNYRFNLFVTNLIIAFLPFFGIKASIIIEMSKKLN